jgi:hypothetical protein
VSPNPVQEKKKFLEKADRVITKCNVTRTYGICPLVLATFLNGQKIKASINSNVTGPHRKKNLHYEQCSGQSCDMVSGYTIEEHCN